MQLLTVKQVAALLGASDRHVLRLEKSGTLRSINIGDGSKRILRFSEDEILRFQASRMSRSPQRVRRTPPTFLGKITKYY